MRWGRGWDKFQLLITLWLTGEGCKGHHRRKNPSGQVAWTGSHRESKSISLGRWQRLVTRKFTNSTPSARYTLRTGFDNRAGLVTFRVSKPPQKRLRVSKAGRESSSSKLLWRIIPAGWGWHRDLIARLLNNTEWLDFDSCNWLLKVVLWSS